jgi:Domain of unknown function (DUF4282)
MQDRSSDQGLPEEWDHGSHAARGAFSGPGAAEDYGAGTAGSHRAGTAEWFGTGSADAHAEAKTDALGVRTDSYGTGKTDAFGTRPAGTYGGAEAADPFGDASRFGDGDRFGKADPFGPRLAAPFGPGTAPALGSVAAEAGTARPEAGRTVVAIADPAPGEKADARGFLGALFDFGFTSFVTPKVIRLLYMLIVTGTVVCALVFTILAFRASVTFGILTLVIGDPLFVLIMLAINRIILEFFVVTFRVADDIRTLRARGDLR